MSYGYRSLADVAREIATEMRHAGKVPIDLSSGVKRECSVCKTVVNTKQRRGRLICAACKEKN